ncbi:uncharacterized protein LOC142538578 [Primulina tabacum]|uniref:uncharacterized protein LOC142538578 n=1 Tax=Primulina tabacum TaxID=48773 RepID=UPI003F59FF76
MAENRDNHNEPLREVPIREHFRSVINAHYSGIARGTIAANYFELKPALINIVQQNQFGEAATADPHLHLRNFLEITDTVNINDVSDEVIRLRLFPVFSQGSSKKLAPISTSGEQNEFEVLYEDWERYKELLRKCPNHGYAEWVQIQLFYNGLDGPTRGNVDAAVGGTIFSKTPDEAYELLEQMTINSYHWPSFGVDHTDCSDDKAGQSTSDVALITTEEEPVVEEAQYIKNNRGYGRYRGNPPYNTYHPGLRNHENFSYANNKNVLNPPPGFKTEKGEGKPSFEDLVGTFVAESGKRMTRTESCLDSMETHMGNMGATMKFLKTQIGHLANALRDQTRGQVPKQYGEPTEENVDILVEEDNGKGRFKKKGLDDQFAKFLEILKKIHINISFADALEHTSNYAKFIKDVMSKKRKLQEFETVKLTEECSAILQRKLPQKLKDPGSFTIPCVIGGSRVNMALFDLGDSINLMPFSIYRTLELGEVKPSTITLQLADRSLTYPRGIVEDVMVKIDKFIFHADFVILDMEEDQETPLIFGRPFLATGKA